MSEKTQANLEYLLPLRPGPPGSIQDSRGNCFAIMATLPGKMTLAENVNKAVERAEFLCLRANSHAGLVEALDLAKAYIVERIEIQDDKSDRRVLALVEQVLTAAKEPTECERCGTTGVVDGPIGDYTPLGSNEMPCPDCNVTGIESKEPTT